MRSVAIIPARLGSRRLPRKMLADLGGRPMIAQVALRARRAERLDALYVATGDDEIAHAVEAAGVPVIRTHGEHASGTDRVAEAARRLGLSEADSVVNIQGDEPFLDPSVVDHLVKSLQAGAKVVTAAAPLLERPQASSVVKVVVGAGGRALYFSRCPIPAEGPWSQHIGVYGFQAGMLQRFTELCPSQLERSERLEQLRFLENGIDIQVIGVRESGLSVDTPEDLARARTIWNKTVQRS